MAKCDRCGAELRPDAKFCVMCGARVQDPDAAIFATSTLTGSGLTVAISTAAICAAIAGGLFVLVRSLF